MGTGATLTMAKLSLSQLGNYVELLNWHTDTRLLDRAHACIEAQKTAAAQYRETTFEPDRTGGEPVSPGALESLVASRGNLQGMSEDQSSSNAVTFNLRNIEGSVMSEEVGTLRRAVDVELRRKLREVFRQRLVPQDSGLFWYPRGGYMGWHTNSSLPGWRLYITFTEETDRSFFRYRDPATGEIVTSVEAGWGFRMFEVSDDDLFWHAVYSETDRFSIGYILHQRSRRDSAKRRLKHHIGASTRALRAKTPA
jgi:hypothetical protein